MTQRIAIVGTGISGLVCAHLLSKEHDVQVFEANDYIGGHTHTVDVTVNGEAHAIDTGFIVFNDWTYPNFIQLMDKLGVKRQPTEMSFSVKNSAQNLEYNGHTLNTLFAQRRNLLRPGFYRFIGEILRFNRLCKEELERQSFTEHDTLGQLLERQEFSDYFAGNYILPMCAAIWSASLEDVKAFPLPFFLRFFNNHGLLNVQNRPQWYTLVGGSRSYIEPLCKHFKDRIHLSCPVRGCRQTDQGWELSFSDRPTEQFDHVILACHSDQALSLLERPTEEQQRILGALPYSDNEVVLHTDTRLLPKRPLAWASWNYLIKGESGERERPASVTYNMNILQRLNTKTTFCVTLNNSDDIDPDKVLRRFHYSHPQFSDAGIQAQQQRQQICGIDGLHFCGAYWYNGFHEDGVRSGLDVCARFGASL
ncbi:hypothetical protein HMF8227_02204 [Saliniradius amylolyticus]|uniref:Amine oxidase domain-containing protein n=1 Tax=Saliniradius amylolyticus TaxID=2183582 RepID=A0A2S2E6Q9_9ALTE|nr:FAD-dependent oxidoreductase [Saliniradius amylolyticus]AWL12657.1 hypothetical protein HMF8227_02204 [Saliniradius amylolyticus]